MDILGPFYTILMLAFETIRILSDKKEHSWNFEALAAFAYLNLATKSIYFLRIPRRFSKFIKVLESVFSDLAVFFLIFILMLFVFAIPLCIMGQSSNFTAEAPLFPPPAIITSVVQVYMTGIGEYGTFTDAVEGMGNMTSFVFYAIFIVTTLTIQICMLNLIIGIITVTFETVLKRENAALY